MPTLGEELKQRREERGVTLAEIAESTRIGTRFLKAIETDNFSILPGGIFTRSFIRAYAKHVGMDEEEAIGLYIKQVAGPSDESANLVEQSSPTHVTPIENKKKSPVSVAPPSLDAKPETSRRYESVSYRATPSRTSWPAIVIGAGIVVFVIIIVVALVKQLNQGSSESGSQATSVSPAKPAPSPAPAQPSAPPANQPAQQPAASANPEGQPLVVKIEAATGDSWVKYQIDDAKPTILILKQGQSQDLPPAQTQVTLNYGNRLTLKLKINNRDANFPPDTPKFASHVVISRDKLDTFFNNL